MTKQLRDKINNILRTKLLSLLLKKILGAASMGGIRGAIVKYLLEHLYDEIVEPLTMAALRKAGYIYNKIDGKIKIDKLEEAKESGDEDAYDDAVRDILS